MLISGAWHLCPDGIVRPVIRGEILTGAGSWLEAPFLVDTGADRTVFSAGYLAGLHLQPIETSDRIGGLGGVVSSVILETQIRLAHDNAGFAVFRGRYAAATDPEALDMSVLGRDIANFFAAIVDRPGDLVCLLGQTHRYIIEQR
jgi:hypothetical protein